MSNGRNRDAVELAEFAEIKYTQALQVVRGERWPDATVRAPSCLVAEWLALRGFTKSRSVDERVCPCAECEEHDRVTGASNQGAI